MECMSEYQVTDKPYENPYAPFEFADEVSSSARKLKHSEPHWGRGNVKEGFTLIRVKWNRTDDLREAFQKKAKVWKKETEFISSIHDRSMHPAYQTIIGMGKSAVPLILQELQANGGHWFWALHHLTGVDPVPASDQGSIRKMREAWLGWARKNRYL